MNLSEARAAWCWRDPRVKPSVDTFKESLRRHFLRAFYHWASAASISSILTYGIRSPAQLEGLGLDHQRRGYGGFEKQAALARYVYLIVKPYVGLVARRGTADAALIEIEPAAAWIDGTLYIPGNSARSSVRMSEMLEMTELEDFEAIFGDASAPFPLDYQAEILVPNSVSPHFIRTITFAGDSAANAARSECASRLAEMPYPPRIDASDDLGVSAGNAIDIDALLYNAGAALAAGGGHKSRRRVQANDASPTLAAHLRPYGR
jgi:hypothetical protein